jgi:hypothetical protein
MLSYTFQPWETLKQKNIKLIQPIYINKVKTYIGNYIYTSVDTVYSTQILYLQVPLLFIIVYM